MAKKKIEEQNEEIRIENVEINEQIVPLEVEQIDIESSNSIETIAEPEKELNPSCCYCLSPFSALVIYGTRPSVTDYKCTLCGKVFTWNNVESVIAWRVDR